MKAKGVMAGLALTALILPTAVQAGDAAIGRVSAGENAFVARQGKLLPATANMPLFAGDRVVTRAGGSAAVAMAGDCNVAVGTSAMLNVNGATCANGKVVSFDAGRAGAPAAGAAFQDDGTTATTGGGAGAGGGILAIAAAAAAGLGIYVAVDGKDKSDSVPVSP